MTNPSSPKPTILIVGAAGFLGMNLTKDLAKQYRVIAGIREHTNPKKISFQKQKLIDAAKPAKIITGDAIDGYLSVEELDALAVDAVIYCAGQPDVNKAAEEFNEKPNNWRETNTLLVNTFGAETLARRCAQAVKKPTFIYLSSIYAANTHAHIISNPAHSAEKHYVCSKRFAEQLLSVVQEATIYAIRLPRMFGSYQQKGFASLSLETLLFPHKNLQIKNDGTTQKLEVPGKTLLTLGESLMQFMPVSHLSQQILSLLSAEKTHRYEMVGMDSRLEIQASPKQVANCLDDIIASRFSLNRVLQDRVPHYGTLYRDSIKIVRARTSEFQLAARTIQEAFKKSQMRKNKPSLS